MGDITETSRTRRGLVWATLALGLLALLVLGALILGSKLVTPSAVGAPAEWPGSEPGAGGGALMGRSAPGFTLRTLNGGLASLSQYAGRPVLINFWASWCVPCREEMPALLRAYEGRRADGLAVLGINLTRQDSVPEAQAFVKEFKITYPILLDETGDVALKQYLVRGLPTSVFVDRTGIVRRVYLGQMTGKQIDDFIEEILK